MRRRGTMVRDPKIQECYRDMFCVRPRQTVKLLLVVILMTNIQGTLGVTVGNGNVFTGDVRGIRPQGNGTYTQANGEKFTGYFEDGMMTGQFLVEYNSGDIYRGDVDEDGIREGKGVYTWPSGSRYEGEWRGGEQHGQGVYTWPDGEKYEGEWKDDDKHGQGVSTWPDGDRFEGEWRDDKKNGQGIYYYANGAKYDGEWRGDVQHGQGVFTWSDGEKYEGESNQGKKNGWGRYIFENDTRKEYDGEWIDDEFSGYGKMVYKDESIYNGQWINHTRDGEGLLLWPNGTCFYGQMKNDKIYHGMIMTPNFVFTYSPYKNTTYNGKGFKVVNFTTGEIECFQEKKDIPCYNTPNEVETIYLGGFDHYFIGDIITIRKRKIRDGFGEYGVDGGYYIGEWKQEKQSGFGLKTEAFLPTIIGTFENGILEGLGASISYSAKHRFIYVGGYKKGQPFGPGMFIYPDGEKVLGYFIEGKLDHTANPIYLHPDGTRDSLVPTSG